MQLARMTYNSASIDKYIMGVRKETWARILSLQIINKGREQIVYATHSDISF